MIFSKIHLTESKLLLIDNNTLMFFINDQLKIHASAIAQMGRNTSDGNDFETVLRVTKAFSSGAWNIQESYGDKIKALLRPYRMLVQYEYEKLQKTIESWTKEENIRQHLKYITECEAYRLRTVLNGAPSRSLEIAYRMASHYGDTSVFSLAAWIEVVKLEIGSFKEVYKLLQIFL